MRLFAALVVVALAAAPATAEVAVRVSGGHVELTATAAPLAEVLDRLARQTGMKVVYEGAAPRQLVTLSLHGRTPTETVLAVFEGLGVNFALVADPSGSRVQTLVVAGTAASSSPSSTAAARAAVPPDRAPAFRPAARSEPGDRRPRFRGSGRGAHGGRGGLRRTAPGGGDHGSERGADGAARPDPRQPRGPGPVGSAAGHRDSRTAHAGLSLVAVHDAAAALPAAASRGPRGAGRSPASGREPHAGQPTAPVGGRDDYGRVVAPVEGGRAVGNAPPGRGNAGPTGRPTTRG